MNIDNLTYGELKAIAAMFTNSQEASALAPVMLGPVAFGPVAFGPVAFGPERPVIVTTDKRGVVFGYTNNADARPIRLARARMCLYWSSDVGGVFGLGEKGPTKDCKISATLPEITLEGVTAIFTVDPIAEKAWLSARVQGR